MDIEHAEYDLELKQAYIYKKFVPSGSLRDIIHKSNPQTEYKKKYESKNTLTIMEISLYGRQILKGIKTLLECGLTFPCLSSGNILIDGKKFECRFTDIENIFLGLPSSYENLKNSPEFPVELFCFGNVLYEMATGEVLNSITIPENVNIDKQVLDILHKIFNQKTSIDQLLLEPLFLKKNDVPSKPIIIKDSKILELISKMKKDQQNLLVNSSVVVEIENTIETALKDIQTTVSQSPYSEIEFGSTSLKSFDHSNLSYMSFTDVTKLDKKKKEEIIEVEEF